MIDTQPMNIRRNGKALFKTIIVALTVMSTLCACSAYWFVGDGRGDWTLDLFDGYVICRVNSYEILLGHKENPADAGGSIIIPNFYISGYQLYKPYICLEGVRTKKMAASDEELNNMQLSYYLIDTTTDEVFGPFTTFDDLVKYGDSIQLEISESWIKPQKAD
jgi:hypothetical protein